MCANPHVNASPFPPSSPSNVKPTRLPSLPPQIRPSPKPIIPTTAQQRAPCRSVRAHVVPSPLSHSLSPIPWLSRCLCLSAHTIHPITTSPIPSLTVTPCKYKRKTISQGANAEINHARSPLLSFVRLRILCVFQHKAKKPRHVVPSAREEPAFGPSFSSSRPRAVHLRGSSEPSDNTPRSARTLLRRGSSRSFHPFPVGPFSGPSPPLSRVLSTCCILNLTLHCYTELWPLSASNVLFTKLKAVWIRSYCNHH